MTKTYYVSERTVAARPRSKRLRMLGGATSTGTSSVSYSSWDEGGSSAPLSLTITTDNSVVTINGIELDFSHNHDWGEIVNKPNLVEGVTVGEGKMSFKLLNGDVIEADFSSIATSLSNKASVASVNALETKVDVLTRQRGMVIDPYVWGTQTDANNADWTGCEGEYWYDTGNDLIKLCIAVNNGAPSFGGDVVTGKCLLWKESEGKLLLYTNYSTPSSIVIYQ